MARARDLPPEPPEDRPTEPIRPDDPYAREEPYARGEEVVEEVYEEPPPEPPRSWWRENLWMWLLLLLLVVVGGIALLWYLQRDGGDSDRAVVPSVVGLSEAEAIRQVQAAGLEAVRNPGESERPEGQVFAQTPGGGAQLKEGEPVVLNVSTGPPSTTTVTATTTTSETVTQPPPPADVTLPDVVGQSQVDAGEQLEGMDLVADSYPVPSDEPAGTVVSQRPAPGTVIKEGETVRLNVSLGPDERETTTVPDVTGDEASEARRRARAEGFTVRTVLRDAPSRDEVGEVLTQTPAADATAPILTQITLFVGR